MQIFERLFKVAFKRFCFQVPSSSKNCIKTQIKQMGNAQFAARVFSGLSVDFCTTVIECFRVRLCKRNAISEPFDKVGV